MGSHRLVRTLVGVFCVTMICAVLLNMVLFTGKKTYWFLINDREIIEKAIHGSEQLKGVLGDIQEIDIARSYHSPRWEWTGKIKPHRYKRYTLEVKGSEGKAIVFAGKYADESGFSLSFLPRKEGISEHEL